MLPECYAYFYICKVLFFYWNETAEKFELSIQIIHVWALLSVRKLPQKAAVYVVSNAAH